MLLKIFNKKFLCKFFVFEKCTYRGSYVRDTCIKVGQKIITVKKHKNTRLNGTEFWIYMYIFSFSIDFKEIFKNVLKFIINDEVFSWDFYFLFSRIYNYLRSIKTCIVFEFRSFYSSSYYFTFGFIYIVVGVAWLFCKGLAIKRSRTSRIQMAAKTRVDWL